MQTQQTQRAKNVSIHATDEAAGIPRYLLITIFLNGLTDGALDFVKRQLVHPKSP